MEGNQRIPKHAVKQIFVVVVIFDKLQMAENVDVISGKTGDEGVFTVSFVVCLSINA